MAGILSELFSLKYSIGDLMNIDKDRMQKSSEMTVNLTNVYHEIKKESIFEKFKKFFFRNKDVMNVYYVIFRFEVSSPSGSVYTVLIRTYPDFDIKNYLDNTVEIFCSCSDFQFRCTYGLSKHKNLYRSTKTDQMLGQAITQAPKVGYKTSLCCKHVYAALSYLSSNYSNIMSNL
jgi:hypothetical protein